MVTDHAHLIALNRFTGELLWDTAARRLAQELRRLVGAAAGRQPGDLRRLRRRARRQRIRRGARSGDRQGSLAILDGAEARASRDRRPGRARTSSTAARRPGSPAATIPELDIVYWPTGNPAKEYNGDDRKGDNLYAELHPRARSQDRQAEVALPVHAARSVGLGRDADLGARRRRLAGAAAQADAARQPQRVLLRLRSPRRHAAAGEAVRQEPDVGQRHRRRRPPDQAARTRSRSPAGTKVCPSQDGATNWFSPSFNPATGLYYVQTFEKCSIYTKSDQGQWESGKTYLGGSQRTAPDPKPQRILRAIDIRTGAIEWELPQPGPAHLLGRHADDRQRARDLRRGGRRA